MNYAVIVAGGTGKRMNSIVPKQFLELDGKPVLYYTIQTFLNFSPEVQIILVLPSDFIAESDFITTYFPGNKNIRVVAGGETRFHSVQNGLKEIREDGIVFIHDGVRPFVSMNVLENCLQTALQCGNAIPCIHVKDSLRHITSAGNHAVSRNEFKAIQTPQTFAISAIQDAFKQDYKDTFTDEASVFEAAGHQIYLVEGNEENIKITTPQDLELARTLIR